MTTLQRPEGTAGCFQYSSGLTLVDQILSVAPRYTRERHDVRAVVDVKHQRYRHAVGGVFDRVEFGPHTRTSVLAEVLLTDALAIQPRGVRVAVREPLRRHR